jgi:DNA polymerase I-like protein with 3'-5' exonuclease and polymerase domains
MIYRPKITKYLLVTTDKNDSLERFLGNIMTTVLMKIDTDFTKLVLAAHGGKPTFSQIRAANIKQNDLGELITNTFKVVDVTNPECLALRKSGEYNVILFGENIERIDTEEVASKTTGGSLYFFYSRQRQQKMRDFLEIELYKLYAGISKFYGYDFVNQEPEVRFCETIDDVHQVCDLIRRAKELFFDFETRPIEDDLSTSEEIKAAALDFKKSLPTMLQLTHQAGIGWVIPMYHYESWFNVGKHDNIVVQYRPRQDGLSTVNYTVVEDGHTWNESNEYLVFKKGTPIKKYNGQIVDVPARWARLIKYHYDLCVEQGIDNYLREVVNPVVAKVFDDPDIRKVGHNVLFDAKIILQHILTHRTIMYNMDDTMYISHGVNETYSKSLDALTFRFLYPLVGYSEGIDYPNASMYKLGTYGVFDIHVTAVAEYKLMPVLMDDPLSYRVHRSLIVPLLHNLLEMEFNGAQVNKEELAIATKEADELKDKLEAEIKAHPLVTEYVRRRRAWEQYIEISNVKAKLAVWRKESLINYRAKLREYHEAKFPNEVLTDNDILSKYYLMDRKTKGMKKFMTLADKIYMLLKEDYFNPTFPLKTGVDLKSKLVDLEIGNSSQIYSEFNCNSNDELSEIIYKEPYELSDIKIRDSRKQRRDNDAQFSTELGPNGEILEIHVTKGGADYKKDCVMLMARDLRGRGAKFAVKIGRGGVIKLAAVVQGGSGYINPKIDVLAFESPSDLHPYFYNQYNLDPKNREPLGLGMDKLYCTRSRKIKGTDETKKESGYFASTGRKILNRLNDSSGFISKVLEYRAINKLLTTYFKGFTKLMDDKGFLHTSYRLIRSMRMSSSNPNLQNIPSRAKEPTVAKLSKKTKGVFQAPSTDYIYYQKDLSQAELRWAAELWDIFSMIDAYKNDKDIHRRTAAAVNQVTEEEVTGEMRFYAKSVNFGYLFAMLAKKFQQMARDDYGINITLKEAEVWRDRFFRLYPEILDAQYRQKVKGHEQGFVRTAFGSKRHLPGIDSLSSYGYDIKDQKAAERLIKSRDIPWEVKNKVLSAERQAVNSPVQGTSGQGMEFSLVVFDYRKKLLDLDGANTNTVHDSGLGYVHKKDAEEHLIEFGDSCDNPPAEEYLGYWLKKVPMKSDDEFGPSWGEQYEIDAPLRDINFDAYNVPNPEYRIGMKVLVGGKNPDIKGKTVFIDSYSNNSYFIEYNNEKIPVKLGDLTFIK